MKAHAIELPLNVSETRAVGVLGGPSAVRAALSNNEPLELLLNPEDPLGHSIASTRASDTTVVLEIDMPEQYSAMFAEDARAALAAAKRNGDQITVTPKLVCHKTVRFRELADFQTGFGQSSVERVLNPLKSMKFDQIHNLDFGGIARDVQDIVTPPRYSRVAVPFDYGYKANPAAVVVSGPDGVQRLVSRAAAPRTYITSIRWGEQIPTAPSAELATPTPEVQAVIDYISGILRDRPLCTRAVFESMLPEHQIPQLKWALAYVAYTWKSGPWRGTYASFGVDPATDKKYSMYQVETFRLTATLPAKGMLQSQEKGHIFDGVHVPRTKTFQLCDITDPEVKSLLEHPVYKDHPDSVDGWLDTNYIAQD
ncbi:hypothetical protein CANCADRAFT_60024 [Tortispora caseinolytica NRRL Y-17796]|uniref:Transcription factor IIIC subunit 5 HTH domain-containing protein n=1 Tax=Tortispora caseinolytica NRRL Y-17796 TaxID=767744 RepID=A0A1E4TM03_9ASCO|nr:hypothetical protein CANCADRAFT_60024 [Tortispora caseinolytica NRRL Y-17796]